MSDYFRNTFEYLISIVQFFEYFFYFLIGLAIFIVSKIIIKITKVLTVLPKKITDIEFHKSIFLKILKILFYIICLILIGKIVFYWFSGY